MKPIEIAKYLVPIVLAALIIVMCKRDYSKPGMEYMPDMAHSKAYETYTKVDDNTAFANGVSALRPVEGTIPRGQKLYHIAESPEGYIEASARTTNPIELTDDVLLRGQEVYSIYCTPCHGAAGNGEGTAVLGSDYRLAQPPIDFTNPPADLTAGKMFYSITYGKNLMGSYASQVSHDDRWKVIHYINTLNAADVNDSNDNTDETAAPDESQIAQNQ